MALSTMLSSHRSLDGSFKKHPLWNLRKYTVLTLVLSLLLAILFPNPPPLYLGILLSFLVITYDLASFIHSTLISLGVKLSIIEARITAQENTSSKDQPSTPTNQINPLKSTDNEETKWPSKLVTIADLILCITHSIFTFILFINTFNHYGWGGHQIILEAYLALIFFALAILHGMAYRKEASELQKSKRARRVREICTTICRGDTIVGCEGCARVVIVPRRERGRKWSERLFGFDIGSSRSRSVDEDGETAGVVRTPSSLDGDGFERSGRMEGGYGTLSESQDLKGEGHVVKKKRSKRAIGEEWEGNVDSKGKEKGKKRAVSQDVDG